MTTANFQRLSNFIWSVADLLRGLYRPPQYERVMLPMTVLRRFDCVLSPTKKAVLAEYEKHKHKDSLLVEKILNERAKDENGRSLGFHNHSPFDFQSIKGDPDNMGRNLVSYIHGFSENIRKIFEYFEFEKEIERMEDVGRLYLVVSNFSNMDLHPKTVDNITMGLVFEDLIRRFNEAANETAGDHFTPREVVHLMAGLLLEPDSHVLTREGIVITVCDPACGTGGMLSEARNWIRAHNESANVHVFGQDYNPRSYAVSASDLLIKGFKESSVELGNTLLDDKFQNLRFDYLLANPPFGVDWKAEQKIIERRPNFRNYSGKLPRVNDGALLFLIHMISKCQPYQKGNRDNRDKRGTRIAIVLNGSPLFTGGAGSGESEIRRWIIEHDWLEAIIALPEQMFYNTGIGTYIWVVSNRKTDERRGKVQLIDARDRWKPMRRSLGNKRRFLDREAIGIITCEHGAFEASDTGKIFDNTDFGYRRITVQRPLRLKFQMTRYAKEQFLDACPTLLYAVLAMEEELGPDPHLDWNTAWTEVQRIVKESDNDWKKGAYGTAQKKLFRECYTEIDPEAEPVIAKHGKRARAIRWSDLPKQTLPKGVKIDDIDPLFGVYPDKSGKKQSEYEPDPKLKDFENIPLKESIVSYFLREVQPYVNDAWRHRQGGLRDQLQPRILQIPTTETLGGDRCRVGGSGKKDHGIAAGGKGVKNTLTFAHLVEAIQHAHTAISRQTGKAINISLTLRNWLIGYYIAEYELNGKDRAEYGDHLFTDIAKALNGISNCNRRQLYRYHRFYSLYPEIVGTLSPQSQSISSKRIATQKADDTPIVETATALSQIEPQILVNSLSYSHFEELVAIDDPTKRTFYEMECIRGSWSLRELKRQIGSLYYERSGLSHDKKRLSEIARQGAETKTTLDIRDPYIFEFLGLKPAEVMSESHLEQQLTDKLQDFLLELGHGFCFEARQKRILIGEEHFFIDLVFYHRTLKCHVLVELKMEKFSHENLGQLNTYVNWYRQNIMTKDDNPPIGILLCTDKNQALVEYALAGMDNHLFVSKYQLELPNQEAMQRFIDEQLREIKR